jgi:hypothetical protein
MRAAIAGKPEAPKSMNFVSYFGARNFGKKY